MFDPWCGFSVFCEKCFIFCLQSCRFCFQLLVMGEQPWPWEVGLVLEQSSCDLRSVHCSFGCGFGSGGHCLQYSECLAGICIGKNGSSEQCFYWQKEGIATTGHVQLMAIWRTCFSTCSVARRRHWCSDYFNWPAMAIVLDAEAWSIHACRCGLTGWGVWLACWFLAIICHGQAQRCGWIWMAWGVWA